MTDADPEFDTVHPSGAILFRSCRGGYAHGVVLNHAAMDTDAQTLAEGILLTADVSYLKALMEVRAEIVAEVGVSGMTVRLAGGDLRSEDGAPAPPESDPGISADSGFQLSH